MVRRVPPAEALFYGSLAIWIASELSIRSRHAGGTGTEADRGSRVRRLVLIVVGIVVAFNLVSIPHTRLDGWWPVGTGAALVVVRHPSYLGGLVSVVGIGLGLGDWAILETVVD